MNPAEIQVGRTYVNRGAGKTKRKVLAIGNAHQPVNWYGGNRPSEPGVLFEQEGKEKKLYLSSFAQWAGKEAVI